MGIREQVAIVKKSLENSPDVQIVAATKYMDIEQTKDLVDAGITTLGENRTDMFLEKYEVFKENKDVKWHFFGVVQSRKIKDIANKIECLHSLDKISVASELDKKLNSPLDCFVQVNISEEEKRSGVAINKVKKFIKELEQFPKIKVIGLMCIAKLSFDDDVLRVQFEKMKKLRDEIRDMKLEYAPCHSLSMGMSNDYKLAIECGATHVRLGRIFLV